MSFSVNRSEFKKALGRLKGVVTKRTPLPDVDKVVLKTKISEKGKFLYLFGTDLEIFLATKITLQEADEFSLAVDFFSLSNFLESVSSEEITLYSGEGSPHIRGSEAPSVREGGESLASFLNM